MFGAIAFLLLTFWKRKSYPTNLLFLAGFTGLEAYSISVVVSFYQSRIVLQAVLLTAGLFIGLTLFACQTKYDFTSWAPYLFGTLWALVLFGFMAIFFPYNSTVELAYSGIAALLFSAYILVDTQLVMRHYHVEEEIAVSSPYVSYQLLSERRSACANKLLNRPASRCTSIFSTFSLRSFGFSIVSRIIDFRARPFHDNSAFGWARHLFGSGLLRENTIRRSKRGVAALADSPQKERTNAFECWMLLVICGFVSFFSVNAFSLFAGRGTINMISTA